MFFSLPFLWGLLGVILVALEMAVPGFTIFFFGAGALLTALLTAVLPPVAGSFGTQLLLWTASSVLSFVFLRRRFAKIFRGTVFNRITGDQDSVGEKLTALSEISPEKPGRVRYQGTSWKAESLTEVFAPGDTVEVVEVRGLTLIVTAPFDGDEKGDDFLKRLEDS